MSRAVFRRLSAFLAPRVPLRALIMNKLNKAQKESVKTFAGITESTCVTSADAPRCCSFPCASPHQRAPRSEKQALEVLKAAEWSTEVCAPALWGARLWFATVSDCS